MQADVKGDIYEGLLAKSAEESPKGAGQYFTPRDSSRPSSTASSRPPTTPSATRPAAPAASCWRPTTTSSEHHGKELDQDQKKHLRTKFVKGWELVPNTARLCIMNLYLHGIDADPCPITSGRGQPGQRPRRAVQPGADQSAVRQEEQHRHRQRGGRPGEGGHAYERQDFWTTTKNKQLNFLQHVKTLLKVNGRCAIVVPDNVLFEGGAGETVRRNLLQAVRRPHAAAAADRHLLRPGREGERPVLRRQAGPGEAVDDEAVGLRPADEHALHAEDEPAEAGRPRRVRGVLPARRTATGASRRGARRTRTAAGGRSTTTSWSSGTR